MEIPIYPRYEYATKMAHEFLLENEVSALPLDPFKIADFMDITIYSYSEIENLGLATVMDLNALFSSEDGVSLFRDGRYYIFYNDMNQNIGRVRFTILHELGHIYLQHFTDFDKTALTRSELSNREYKVLEDEVNCFARNALVPVPVVLSLEEKNDSLLVSLFNISKQAAKTRLGFLKTDYNNVPLLLFEKLSSHFKSHIFRINNSYFCIQCNHITVHSNPTHCTVCGINKIEKNLNITGAETDMIYPGHQISDEGKAYVCPRCQNEETQIYGEHCIQCSLFLYNYCSLVHYDFDNNEYRPCPNPLPGNARYCPTCGAESTFLQQEVLESWQTVKNKIHEDPFVSAGLSWPRE